MIDKSFWQSDNESKNKEHISKKPDTHKKNENQVAASSKVDKKKKKEKRAKASAPEEADEADDTAGGPGQG